MKQIIRNIFLTIAFVIAFAAFSEAQKQPKQMTKKQQMKALAEKKAQRANEEQAALEEIKQMHYDNQTKDVQKRMKQTQKKSKRLHKNKKEFFIVRWFRDKFTR